MSDLRQVGQIIVGVPLEMSHPTSRVATVFIAGVVGGALGSAVLTTDEMPLTGASGTTSMTSQNQSVIVLSLVMIRANRNLGVVNN